MSIRSSRNSIATAKSVSVSQDGAGRSSTEGRLEYPYDQQQANMLEDILVEIKEVRHENERLRRQQEDAYGLTLDTVERMKAELERAKTTRKFLMEDIDIRKAKSERMEADIFELNMKLEACTRKLHGYDTVKEQWSETSAKLHKTEEKCEKLSTVNKQMKMVMLKHNIDPDMFDGKGSRAKKDGDKRSRKPGGSNKSKVDQRIGRMSSASGKSKAGIVSRDDVGDVRKHGSSYNGDQTLGDRLQTSNTDRSSSSITAGSPPYLGRYSNIYHNRMQLKAKSESVHLPKLVVT